MLSMETPWGGANCRKSAGAKLLFESLRESLELFRRKMIDAVGVAPTTAGRKPAAEDLRRDGRLPRHPDGDQATTAALGRDDRDGAAGVRLGEIVGQGAAGPARPGRVRELEQNRAAHLSRWREAAGHRHVLAKPVA